MPSPHLASHADDRFEIEHHAGFSPFILDSSLEQDKFMSLQQLVTHFNDRFEDEHHSDVRPFILENGLVNGLFGPIRIGSDFLPIRYPGDNDRIAGHAVQLSAAPYNDGLQDVQVGEFDNWLGNTAKQAADFQSIINLDRLCRTVHMLNYLRYAHKNSVLFLDVDPRHILGVKQDHGAYFEEIIVKCGLATKNIVISVALNSFYALHHAQLLEGLNNYRQRGYQIAVNVGPLYSANGLVDFIVKLSPQYLRANVPEPDAESAGASALATLKELQNLVGGQAILQQVNGREQAAAASALAFDLVQGSYFDKLSEDYLRCM